jgi:hypothetical protein
MKSLEELKSEELKKEVFYKLSKYPKMEAFFRDSLEQRMKLDGNWIENPLVLLILDDESFKSSELHTLIDKLYGDPENFKILRSKLNPKDKYDKKMPDRLAELDGYWTLKQHGFFQVVAIAEDSKQKKPDFSAELSCQSYLFEVKNLRAPIEVCDLLLTKTEARGHRFPEIYKTNAISFRVSEKWWELEFNRPETDDIKKKVEEWLEGVFNKIESAVSPMPFTNEDLIIKCLLPKGKKLRPSFGYIHAVRVSDSRYKQRLLSPFANKVRRTAFDAARQLLESDKSNVHRKYVLLNWQKSFKYKALVWNGFENDAHGIVKGIDVEIKNTSENLFVRLLNSDRLP